MADDLELHEPTPEDDPPGVLVPYTGELIRADDDEGLLRARASLSKALDEIHHSRRIVDDAILERKRILGTKTIHAGSFTATISGGTSYVYDEDKLEDLLRKAGMPEERIAEIVVQTVTKKVKVALAKRAASANPDYAAALEASKVELRGAESVKVQ